MSLSSNSKIPFTSKTIIQEKTCRDNTVESSILSAKPRPGRRVKSRYVNCEPVTDSGDESRTPLVISRDYRISKAIKVRRRETCKCNDDAREEENALKYILSCVITTVMLMASEYPDIDPVQLTYTAEYLECIKDDFGHTPPNVRGLLNQIYGKVGKPDTLKNLPEEDYY